MMKLSFALASILPSVLAQYGGGGGAATSSTSAAATSTSSSSSSVQTITLGKSGLTFDPESVVVAPGKQVVFQFYPGDHGVAEGSFSAPCKPSGTNAFYSGFVDSSSGPASKVFTVNITSTDPVYLYCPQVSHCQAGMVAVINPPSTGGTLAAYKSAAKEASGSTAPATVQGGTLGSPSTSTASTPSTSSTTTSATPKSDGRLTVQLTLGSLVFAVLPVLFGLV